MDAERDGDGALVAHHAEQAGARGGDARGRRVLDDLAPDVDEEREADELAARQLRVRAAAVPLVELGGDARLPRRHRRARLGRSRARRDVRRVEVDRLLHPDGDNVGPRRTPQPVADRLVGRRLGRDVPARRDDVDGIARRIVVDAAGHVARHPLFPDVREERRVVLLRRRERVLRERGVLLGLLARRPQLGGGRLLAAAAAEELADHGALRVPARVHGCQLASFALSPVVLAAAASGAARSGRTALNSRRLRRLFVVLRVRRARRLRRRRREYSRKQTPRRRARAPAAARRGATNAASTASTSRWSAASASFAASRRQRQSRRRRCRPAPPRRRASSRRRRNAPSCSCTRPRKVTWTNYAGSSTSRAHTA